VNARQFPTDELLRIAGEDRARCHPEDVSDAERELVVRLGGTTKRVERATGLARGAAGLCIALLGVVALLAALRMVQGLRERTHLSAAAGAVAFVGALVVGMAILLMAAAPLIRWTRRGWSGWLVEELIRRGAAAGRPESLPEHLLRIIGSGRLSHSAEEVNQALRQIRGIHGERLRAVRRGMRRSAGVGAYVGLVGTIIAARLVAGWLSGDPVPLSDPPLPPSAPQWLQRTWGFAAHTSFAAFLLTMPFLLAGCAGLVFCRNWGRRMVAYVLGAWLAVGVVMLEWQAACAIFPGPERRLFIAFTVGGVGGLAFYALLLRSVCSSAVREVCGACGPLPRNDQGRSSTGRA
jgi:hypothetical protein